MSSYKGQAGRLTIYGMAGMLFFFIGCVAVVLASALAVEWLLVLWGVAWFAALVMVVTSTVKT